MCLQNKRNLSHICSLVNNQQGNELKSASAQNNAEYFRVNYLLAGQSVHILQIKIKCKCVVSYICH